MWWRRKKVAAPVHTPDWELYVRGDNAIAVDLGVRAAAPQPQRPVLLRVAIELRAPSEAGFLSEAEEVTIAGLERAVTSALAPLEALPVAKATRGGLHELSFYAASDADAESLVRGALGGSNYVYRVHFTHDATWSWYVESLYPDEQGLRDISDYRAALPEIERQLALTHAIVSTLRGRGDDTSRPRRIDFNFNFPTDQARDAFAAWASSWGYQMDNGGGGNDEKAAAPYTLLVFSELPADVDVVHAHERLLLRKAMTLGGRYEGWGCFLPQP